MSIPSKQMASAVFIVRAAAVKKTQSKPSRLQYAHDPSISTCISSYLFPKTWYGSMIGDHRSNSAASAITAGAIINKYPPTAQPKVMNLEPATCITSSEPKCSSEMQNNMLVQLCCLPNGDLVHYLRRSCSAWTLHCTGTQSLPSGKAEPRELRRLRR